MLIACVDVPVLPLQMLLWRCQDWAGQPVAVVDRDTPQGFLLWVNELARRRRVLPGMRYAAALSLEPRLRASVVADDEISTGVSTLIRRLQNFSPAVEPSATHPGVFWVDIAGILPLYPTYLDWARRVRVDLSLLGFRTQLVVGFSRFATYAAARAAGPGTDGVVVFDTPEAEQAHCRRICIDRLDFDPKLRATLHKLGVRRLGQFVDLPAKGIRRRLGADAYELHRLARGDAGEGLQPAPPSEPLERTLLLDHPDADLEGLLETIEGLLGDLLQQLGRRHELLTEVRMGLRLDDGEEVDETLTPAAPTRDVAQLLSLIRLRLAGVRLSAGVTELCVEVRGVRPTNHQLDLFERPARDLGAARRALARLRAEFGDAAVVCACPREGHMPEARFCWERFEQLETPRPAMAPAMAPAMDPAMDPATDSLAGPWREAPANTLVRRYYPTAVRLALPAGEAPAGWQIHPDDGPIEDVIGPHVVSGGWWLREVARDYYYVLTRSGRWLWIYRDRRRRRWFMQGEVE